MKTTIALSCLLLLATVGGLPTGTDTASVRTHSDHHHKHHGDHAHQFKSTPWDTDLTVKNTKCADLCYLSGFWTHQVGRNCLSRPNPLCMQFKLASAGLEAVLIVAECDCGSASSTYIESEGDSPSSSKLVAKKKNTELTAAIRSALAALHAHQAWLAGWLSILLLLVLSPLPHSSRQPQSNQPPPTGSKDAVAMVKSSELTSLVGGASPPQDIEQQLPTLGRKVQDRARVGVLRRVSSLFASCSWGLLATLLWLAAVVLYVLFHVAYPLSGSSTAIANAGGATFRFSFASEAHQGPVTGRLLICLAKKHAVEDPMGEDQPRFLVDDSADTQQAFGVDVYDFYPDTQSREINASDAKGYPVLLLEDIPDDEYWVQGVLHPYVHYNRSDAQQLWLPSMDTFESGEGVLTSPGTLFSKPQLVKFSASPGFSMDIAIDQVTPPLPPLEETEELLKHIEFRSPMLSEFWGVDVFLKAWVLLPHKFFDEATKDIKYPLFVYHTHYNPDFEFDFRSQKPVDESVDNHTSHRRVSDWYGYYLYANWTSEAKDAAFTGKRGIIVQLQHANPYYDDSYAVNSANIGPYGDAITYEFLPYIEQQFRGIGEGWARTMYGGSTGGWESFAVQVYYPEDYNGCWSFCPDAFDFRKFQIVNLLEDPNAYYVRGDWTVKNRGASRNYLGQIRETMEEENHHEMVLGSRGRSGGQWDAWQAVYSPLNETDGHPMAIWDKLTGEINHETVKYWEEHFDVRVKLEREWNAKGLGAKLVNKLHVFVGVTDSYYLNDAVYYLEDFLKTTQNPYFNGSIEYGVKDGKGFEHCWTGDYDQTLSMAWNTLNQRMVPQMVDHIVASAPRGTDLSFTTY